MRRDGKINPQRAKQLARIKYAERQIEKYIKWTIEKRGYLKYKDIVWQHEKYNIKVYG